jgi:hypothetical protein
MACCWRQAKSFPVANGALSLDHHYQGKKPLPAKHRLFENSHGEENAQPEVEKENEQPAIMLEQSAIHSRNMRVWLTLRCLERKKSQKRV